jgi:hypothetical protein
MNAKDLARVLEDALKGKVRDVSLTGSNDYVQLPLEDLDGNTFVIKVIQLNVEDGHMNNAHDCVMQHNDF